MNEVKRILHLCSLNAGGIEAFVMNVYRKIDKDKINFDFYNYFSKDEKQFYEDEAIKMGARVYKTGCYDEKNCILRNYKKIISLYKLIRQNEYDIVHIHGTDCSCLREAITARIAGTKEIIIHSHNTSIESNSIKNKIKKVFHNVSKFMCRYLANYYFACSNLAAKWMYTKSLIDGGKVKIINNGIEINKYAFNEEIRNRVRNNLNLNEKLVIGHVGRFFYQKNHELLIDIFNEIIKIHPNSELLLIGDGELFESIKSKVELLNLSKSVKFLGVVKNVNIIMQAMDIFLLPSHFEGLPVVGIEAQASGLKLYVSDTISRELDISGNVNFMSLDLKCKKWAEKIVNESCYERKNMYEIISGRGYNIENIAIFFQKFYLNEGKI